jgi:hypothetical protein
MNGKCKGEGSFRTLFDFHRHPVGNDLLLIADARRQIAHKTLKERVAIRWDASNNRRLSRLDAAPPVDY